MRLPKKVTIAEKVYDIIHAPQSIIDKHMKHARPGTYKGLLDADNHKLYTNTELDGAPLARLFLHEMIHALLERLIDDHEEEERIVLILEERLAGLIRNNPKVIKYLQETL